MRAVAIALMGIAIVGALFYFLAIRPPDRPAPGTDSPSVAEQSGGPLIQLDASNFRQI